MEERGWYIIQTYSGLESTAKHNIELRIKSMGMEDKIFQLLVPERTIIKKNKKGEERQEKQKIYPGYIFVDMIVTDKSWFMVRNTPMVTGFLGSSGGGAKPVPMLEEEISPILKQCGINKESNFGGDKGDAVTVISGNYAGFNAVIDNVDDEKGIVTVSIDMFGRPTLAELKFNEVELSQK